MANFKRIDNGYGCGYSWLCTLNGAEIEKDGAVYEVWKNAKNIDCFTTLKEAKEFCEKIKLNSNEFMMNLNKTIFFRCEEQNYDLVYTVINTEYQPSDCGSVVFKDDKRYVLTYSINFKTAIEAIDYLHFLKVKI